MILQFKKMQLSQKRTKVESIAEIRECERTGNKSLHATIEFLPGQVIRRFGAKETLNRPNYLTVQISDRRHIMLDPEFLQYINHSCDPNVFFDTANWMVIALKTIKIGEELTFFYPSTEWSMDQPFNCCCKSKNCLKNIRGAAHLPLNILKKYQLSQHIKKMLRRSNR